MSTNYEFFRERWSQEIPAFVKVLRALPGDRLDYKPHEKNTAAGDLAWQLAVEAGNLPELIKSGVIHFAVPEKPGSIDAIVEQFEKNAAATTEALGGVDDAKWRSKGDFQIDGQSVWSGTIQDLCWGYLFDMVHHRGQLTAYIRPMGGKVPSVYGPSADDPGAM